MIDVSVLPLELFGWFTVFVFILCLLFGISALVLLSIKAIVDLHGFLTKVIAHVLDSCNRTKCNRCDHP
jgi:hypothetical protein